MITRTKKPKTDREAEREAWERYERETNTDPWQRDTFVAGYRAGLRRGRREAVHRRRDDSALVAGVVDVAMGRLRPLEEIRGRREKKERL